MGKKYVPPLPILKEEEATALAEALKSLNIKRRHFAAQTDISEQMIGNLITRRRGITPPQAESIYAALHDCVDVEFLKAYTVPGIIAPPNHRAVTPSTDSWTGVYDSHSAQLYAAFHQLPTATEKGALIDELDALTAKYVQKR